jgi:hypothetical protein
MDDKIKGIEVIDTAASAAPCPVITRYLLSVSFLKYVFLILPHGAM